MQTLPACRVYTLQIDERCTASRALTETLLSPTAHRAAENGQRIGVMSFGLGIPPAPHSPLCRWEQSARA